MMSKQNLKSNKKAAPLAFQEANKLLFDRVVGWDVEDMCIWLEQVSSQFS